MNVEISRLELTNWYDGFLFEDIPYGRTAIFHASRYPRPMESQRELNISMKTFVERIDGSKIVIRF